MRRARLAVRAVALVFAVLALAGCAHPEDRRWKSVADRPASQLPASEIPSVQVYAFSPPKAESAKPTARDFSDRGQAALIVALAAKAADPEALRKALAAPIVSARTAEGTDDRTRLTRTLVVSISKGSGSLPGDRLVRTEVTITPAQGARARKQFEFAGYSVAATDNRIQNIAHLEDETTYSLKGSLAPKIGGFGDNGLEASLGGSRKSTADIVQQYENLNVDITPDRLVLTRESERGLDVVGNTLVSLTLAPAPETSTLSAFIVSAQKLIEKGKPLAPGKEIFALSNLRMFAGEDLRADVTLRYVLRRIIEGREYYTEGKQKVELVYGDVPIPVVDGEGDKTYPVQRQILARASDTQPELFVVCAREPDHHALMASTPDGRSNLVTYESIDDARAMAHWLSQKTRRSIGGDGIGLMLADDLPLPAGISYYPMAFSRGCSPIAPR